MRIQRDELERLRGEVPEKAQQRIAELARRILEISKEKAAADQLVLEGNDKINAAMKTVEEFRQMQRETEARLMETERARESDRARYEASIKGLKQELDMQTTLYKKYVERIGASPMSGSPVPEPVIIQQRPPSVIQHEPSYVVSAGNAALEAKLAERDAHIKELQDALAQARAQLEEHWKNSVKEKQATYEQLRESQKDSDFAMQQMRQDLEAAQDKIRALLGEKKNFDSLMELYEQVKSERDELRKECFTAAVEAETAKRTQNELQEQLRQQAIDRAAQEKLAEELFKERDAREKAQKELRMKEDQFLGELGLKDRQLELHQDSYRQGQKAGRDEMELKLREVEREKAMIQEDLQRARSEIVRLQDQLQRIKEDLVNKDKEIKDWCSAFQTAEKHKVSMGLQHDELKADKNAVQQEKVALELRVNVLQQHIERLERQLKEEQERNDRLTQAHADKELSLAQKELEFRDRELRLREATTRQKDLLEKEHSAATAMEKQKIAREIEMVQREAELRDQAQRRDQERLLEQSAQELAAKELEIATLKKEIGQLRGQQGHLQQSLNTALGQVASLGQQYAADQAAAQNAHRVTAQLQQQLGTISPARTHRSPSPHGPTITHELRYNPSAQAR
eukprot:Sspe_Gene.34448::Locus_16747_Transcript_1_1_Confidence_1.000_Length_2506::g.34448::m.34448